MRKYNPSILEQFKDLKSINVPKEKRREYAKYMTGICNYINGNTDKVEEAIEEAKNWGYQGKFAVDYIDQRIHERDSDLEEA